MLPVIRMEFEKVIRKRRMVRNFTEATVSDQDLTIILELALHAPSAGFSQGWSYIVVRDLRRRKEVGRVQGETEDHAVGGFANFISQAPVNIIACTILSVLLVFVLTHVVAPKSGGCLVLTQQNPGFKR
jgi:nitroreductase